MAEAQVQKTDAAGGLEQAKARFKERLRQKWKEKGVIHPEDEVLFDPRNMPQDGSEIVHQMAARIVTLKDNIITKSGRGVKLYEADALRAAEATGIPVPHVYKTETTPDGRNHISMSRIEGQTLAKVWDDLSSDQRKAIAGQLREILVKLQSYPAPENYIGGCDRTEIRDVRSYSTYTSPPCQTEKEFVDGPLLSGLPSKIPSAIYNAFHQRLHSRQHRIVLTHGDLSPRNIMIKDGNVSGIIDWEDGGWYPEYWEYVKFLHRFGGSEGYWAAYAEDIFPRLFPDELVDYIALARWQP